MGTWTATEKHRASKHLERACLFRAAFTGSCTYSSLWNTQTALRPLENWLITARRVRTHIWAILSAPRFGNDVAHASALQETCSGESWAETQQDSQRSGTPRSCITDSAGVTAHITTVHKSDFSLTNYNGKNRTLTQSRAKLKEMKPSELKLTKRFQEFNSKTDFWHFLSLLREGERKKCY